MSRKNPPPLPLDGLADFFHTRAQTIAVPEGMESDAECWERMLMLQKEYHCYKSARLEAAVEALEMGFGIEEVGIREFTLNLHLHTHDSDYEQRRDYV